MKKIAIAALAVVLAGVAVIGGGIGLAAAQDEDAPVKSFLGRVAEKLGIGEDELSSAIAEVEGEIVDEKVADGLLTPEQGERLRERIEENGPLGPRALHGIRQVARYHGARLLLDSAATVLEMEPEELRSALQEGNTLAEIAEEQGMSEDAFTAALLEEARAKLDELVADGEITDTQADTAFERLEENIDTLVNCPPCGAGFHGPPGAFFGGGPQGTFFGGGPPAADFEGTGSIIQA